MNLLYGRIERDGLRLYDPLSPGKKISSSGDGIIISASDSHLYAVPTQLTKDEQIRAFISQYIRSIHPGPYDDLITDYYLTGSGKKRTIILCLMHKEVLAPYQNQGKPLYYLFQLVKKPGLYSLSLGSDRYGVFDTEINGLDSYETEKAPDDALAIGNGGLSLHPVKAFRRPAFSQRKKSIWLPVAAAVILSGLLLFSLLDLFSLYRERGLLTNDLAAAREHQKKMVAAENRKASAVSETSPLRIQMTGIADSVPADAYGIMQSLAQAVERRVLISNLVFTEERIDLRGETDNALELVSDLYGTGLFQEIIPSSIQPTLEGERERFNITGVLK